MPRVFCDNNDCIHNSELICQHDDEIGLTAVGGENEETLKCIEYTKLEDNDG